MIRALMVEAHLPRVKSKRASDNLDVYPLAIRFNRNGFLASQTQTSHGLPVNAQKKSFLVAH